MIAWKILTHLPGFTLQVDSTAGMLWRETSGTARWLLQTGLLRSVAQIQIDVGVDHYKYKVYWAAQTMRY